MIGKNRWRYPEEYASYDSCKLNEFGSGIVIWNELSTGFSYIDSVKFQSLCNNIKPIYSAFRGYHYNSFYLPIITKDWDAFIYNYSNEGAFGHSIYSMVYAFTASYMITVFLTVIVFIGIKTRPYKGASYVIKLGSILGCINLTHFVVRSIKELKYQHTKSGVSLPDPLLEILWVDSVFTSIDFVVVLLLESCQVQIVMRFFDRTEEKKIIFFCGMILSIVSQVLWAIPIFSGKINPVFTDFYLNEHMDIFIPFVYLFRISLATSYAIMVCLYIFTKKHLCFRGKPMSILTILTTIIVLIQPGLFILGITNIWLGRLCEIFNTTCYMGSTVIVWEWVDRLSVLERKKQAQSVIGRIIYEDEQEGYYFAKYGLGMQAAMTKDTGYDMKHMLMESSSVNKGYQKVNIVSVSSPDTIQFNKSSTLWERIHNFLDLVLYYSSNFIIQILKNKLSKSRKDSYNKQDIQMAVRQRIGLDKPNETYVYMVKDILFDSDDEYREADSRID